MSVIWNWTYERSAKAIERGALDLAKMLSSVTRKEPPNVYKSGPKMISLEKW